MCLIWRSSSLRGIFVFVPPGNLCIEALAVPGCVIAGRVLDGALLPLLRIYGS